VIPKESGSKASRPTAGFHAARSICAEDKSENTAGRLRGRSTRVSKSKALDERNVGIVRSPIRAIVLLELSKIFSLIHSPTLLLI